MKGYKSVSNVKKHSQRPDRSSKKRNSGIWSGGADNSRVSELLEKMKKKT